MSRLLKCRTLTTALLLTSMALGVSAQITAGPALFNFQGRLATPSGNPVPNGTYSITLSLWDAASSGNKRWEQTFANIAVSNGTFAALLNLGSGFTAGNTIDTAINGATYLEIKIGADAALTPRQMLVSAPYALKANTVPDASITAAKIANGTLTADKFAAGVLTGVAGGDLTGNYPNPQLRTGADLLYKVSGTLMTAIGSGTVVDAQQNTAPLVGVDYAWQSFTASATGLVQSLDIWCGTSTGQNKTATLQIFDGEGVSGTLLRTYSVTITPTSRFQTFTVSVPVVGGQKYTWQLGTSASTRYGYSPGNLYSGGKSDLGDTLDYAFRTFLQGASSPQITSAANFLVNSSWLGIANNGYLETGYGVSGKEINAGKIGYGLFTPNTLDILGGGTTGNNRAIKFWNEGGAAFTGNLNVNTTNLLSLMLNGNGEAGNDTGIGHPADGTITLRTDGVERMRVTNGGAVGLGTINPLSRLHISGDLTFENMNIISAKNSGGVNEGVFWPRWSDNQTYLNYGGGGFNIRNNGNNPTMFMTNSGNVGIGATNPVGKLDVRNGNIHVTNNSGSNRTLVGYNGGVDAGYFQIFNGRNNLAAGFGADNNFSDVYINNGLGVRAGGIFADLGGAEVYVNNSAGTRVITLNSANTYFDTRIGVRGQFSNVVLTANGTGADYAVGSQQPFIAQRYDTTSDARLKTNIVPLPNALETILGLRGVSYDWNPNTPQYNGGKAGKEIGFLAQEIEKLIPALVHNGLEGYKAVNYQGIIPYLVEAMKIQQKQLTAKEERLSAVEAENATLKAQMQNILERLQQLEQNRQSQK